MRLFIDELITELSQRVKADTNCLVEHVRPHLYVKNIPTGSLTVQICSDDGTLIATSNTVSFSSITSSIEYHGYIRFDVSAFLMKDTFYTIKIIAGGGYSFAEAAYCGVCNTTGFEKYPTDIPIVSPRVAPLDLEVWTRSL